MLKTTECGNVFMWFNHRELHGVVENCGHWHDDNIHFVAHINHVNKNLRL